MRWDEGEANQLSAPNPKKQNAGWATFTLGDCRRRLAKIPGDLHRAKTRGFMRVLRKRLAQTALLRFKPSS
jgi:hypothetical protein